MYFRSVYKEKKEKSDIDYSYAVQKIVVDPSSAAYGKVNVVSDFYGFYKYYENSNFNKPIIIGNEVYQCCNMFQNSSFNQDIIIPKNTNNCQYMFANCLEFGKNIYINGSPSIYAILYGKNNSKRVNVFCSNFIDSRLGEILKSYSVTWDSMTNGWYNAAYNIYVYNNYGGT